MMKILRNPVATRSLLRNIPFLVLAIVASTGCHDRLESIGIKGNGIAGTETRSLPAYAGVDVRGAIHARIVRGTTPSATIRTDENLLKLVRTEVRNGTLVVELNGVVVSGATDVELTAPPLKSISASGASEVSAPGDGVSEISVTLSGASQISLSHVAAETIRATVSGASTLFLDGHSRKVSLDLSGSSEAQAIHLEADTVDLLASGASQANVVARAEISGSLSGASEAVVKGSPPIQRVRTSGASSIQMDD